MKHALTMWNDIVPVLEESEPEGIDVAGLIERNGHTEWVLLRSDMIFESKDAAKKYIFMKKLKGK
jgi:hypothetical protein